LKSGTSDSVDAVRNCNASKVGTGLECGSFDAGDTAAYREADQAGASCECITTNVGDTIRDCYAGEACAVRKRAASDAPNAGRDCVTANSATGVLENGGLLFVKQYPVKTAVGRVVSIHSYCCQVGASKECSKSDVANVPWDHHAG